MLIIIITVKTYNIVVPQMQGKADGPAAQRPGAADHRAHVGSPADGVRGERDGSVRVVRDVRNRAVAKRQRRNIRPVHSDGVRAVRAHRGQVRPAAAVHGLVPGHHAVSRVHSGAAVPGRGRIRSQLAGRLAPVGQRVWRRVLHQHRAHARAVCRPVRVLPVGHPGPGQLGGGVHHHVHVHHHAEDLPAGDGRVRQARQLRGVRGDHLLGRPVLLLLCARDQGQVVPADPDRLRDVRLAQKQNPPPELRADLIWADPLLLLLLDRSSELRGASPTCSYSNVIFCVCYNL